jgi:glycosyltransferase involved in cell wall biosynthesis
MESHFSSPENPLTQEVHKPLRVAMIGMRGLPADLPQASGGERETEAKATRLAQRGHQVTVYCRWHYNREPLSPWRGVRLVSLPSINTKNLDTLSHTLLATLHVVLLNTADIVSYHGMGNALILPLAKLGGKKTLVYMDGIDWERPKWGFFARLALQIAAFMAFKWADGVYVDNQYSAVQFHKLFGKTPEVITLASDVWEYPGSDRLCDFGLESDKYILFVGALKPDKGVHTLVEAYERLDTGLPLIIVGDDPTESVYVRKLKSTLDKRIRFLGYVYGSAAKQLFANCHIYVQPSVMEGNSPSLMSAMACSRCVVVSDIEPNLETIGNTGAVFRSGDASSLCQTLAGLLNAPDQIHALGELARVRIQNEFNWEVVVDQLERFYQRL